MFDKPQIGIREMMRIRRTAKNIVKILLNLKSF